MSISDFNLTCADEQGIKMDLEYTSKFEEMKKYIPLLENMIKKLESTKSPVNLRQAQLDKIRSLRDLLLDNKKGMNLEILLKCEQVLINLYGKLEQNKLLPVAKKGGSESEFSIDSPTPKEKSDLEAARNKLKVSEEIKDTLPEIARACEVQEECTSGPKEPALFQRRPNTFLLSPSNNYQRKIIEETKTSEISKPKRNYTRVLISPENNSRRSFDNLREPINRSSAYRSLFCGRSSRKSPKSYSRERSCSYYKSERRKSSKDSCSRKSFKDTRSSSKASLSRKSFKESFSRKSYMHISDVKMNTNDTLPGIVKCNRDVDMDVLEELREQIIGELQKTPSLDYASEVLANSDVNKLELQQSENELIELSDISVDSVEYISDQKNVDQSEKLLDNVNNDVQICLVITSTKNQSDNTPTVTDNLIKNDNTLTCNDYKCKEKPELNVGDISHNSDKLQISNKMVETHLVESEHNLVLSHLENKLDISSKASDNLDNLDLQKNLNITQTQSKATTIPLNSTMDSSEVFVSTFEKYTSEMLEIKKNIHNTQIQPNNIEHAEITEESLNKYNATPVVLKNNEFSIEEKLEQMEGSAETLLSKPTVTQEYTEKIIQALKNEILGEIVSIPETATMTPRLPISKDVKTTSVQENMHKKRISFEKYKENIAKLTKPHSFPNKSSHTEVIASVNAPTKADIVNNYVVDMNSSTFASFTCNISSPFSKGIRDPSADAIFKVAKNIGRFSENIMMNDDQKIPFLDSCESLSSSGSVQVSIPYAIQPKQTPIASTATSVVTHQVQSYKITQCYQTGEIQLCDNVDSKSKSCSRKWDLNNVSSNDIQEDKKRISKADCPQTSLLFEKKDPPVALSQMFEPLNPLPLVRDNCLTTPSHSRSDFIPTPSNVTELIDWLRTTNPSFRTYTDKNEYNSKLKLSSIHSSTCPLTPNNIFGGSDFALTTNISVKLPKTDINNFNQDSGFNRDIEYESSSQVLGNEKKQEKKQSIQSVTLQNYERETVDSDDKFKNHTEDRVSLVSKDEKIYESRSSTFSDYKNNKTSLYSNKQSYPEIESSVYHNEKVVSSEQDDNKHCFLSKESSIERTQFKDITTTSPSINLINNDSLPETISSTVNSDEIIAASTSKECPLADSSNENSKINVTSLDPLESKTKEVSLNSKKGELTLTSVATLLSILQNKSKLKEVLNKLDSDFKENEKIKKTLKKITKVMSDVDDDMANDTEKEHTKYKGDLDFRTGVKDDNLLKKSGEVLNPIKESYENVEVKEIDTESYKNTMKGYENIEDKKSDTKIDKKSVNKRCELEVNDKSRPQSKSKSKQLKMKVINNVEKRTRVSGANPILSTPVALNLSCELLKLQKSTKEIFLKENTLNSRGKSVLCNEDKNAGAFQEPVVILKKLEDMESTKNDKFYLDIEKKKYKYSTPKVKIRSLSPTHEPETIVPSKYKPISKSIKTLTKEHVTTNAGKANQINAGNDDQLLTHELSCTSSIIFSSVNHSNNAKKKIKRRCSSWQAGKIKRKQKKKNIVSKMVECQQIKEDTLKNQDSDINIFVDRTYCFRKNVFTYKCQLCPYVGKNIVHHYRGEHPHNEIPISRMAPMLAKKAIRLCTEIDFKTMNTISCEKYVCIFCSKEYSTGTKAVLKTFFWHIVKTHTGEYMQTCTECENVGNCPLKLHIPAPPSDVDRELKGYICKICNFTQISLENLKTHMILRHNDQQAEFYEINLSIISEKILKALLYRCDHESKPSLSMKYEDVVPKNTGNIEDNVVNTPTKELIHASDDIIDYPHFKIRFTKSGAKEYVCCINRQEKHYKATLLISLKKHVQKHSENWDGYCYVCKVIVTPQGMHSFIDCLEHYLGMHMDNFPVLENEFASHSIDVQESTKNITLNESNIGLCTLSKSVTKEEHLPKITNVVSLGAPNAQTLETYQANINELVVKRQSYEDVQAKIMLSKHRVILDSMLCREKLIKLFKCAGRFCSFTTDLFEDAILHASTHQRMGGIDAFICSYCNFDSDGKPTELVTHVFETHGNCLYSCGRCFYRAAASQLVGAHMSRIHSTTSQEVVLRATVRSSTEAVITELSREHVQYFVCGHNDPNGKCKFRTYTPDKFCEHLQHRHSSNTSHPCNNCSMEFLTPHDLVVHNIKSHDLKLYQCPWCVHGADTENELLGHLSALHPSNQPQAYLRILTYNKDKSNVFKVLPLAFLNKSKVPTEDVILSIREDPVREAERSVELEKLVGHAKLIVKAANKSTVNDKSSIKTERSFVKDIPVKTLVGQLVATTSHDNIIYKDPALNKKPANTPTEQSAGLIVSDSYKDQSPNVTDPFPINKISHEFKKVPLHILYQCPKCRLMCWSMTGLKEHLLLCLNQENITLTCPHCLLVSSSNQTELLAHYEEDHREHDRHECGECGQNFESLKAAKEHIQFAHSVKLHEVITSSQNGIIHYTVCALKRRGQLKRKLSHNEIEATVPKLSCLPQETVSNQLDTGPTKSLYWQCGLCIFKSILRSEVIDHCSEIHKSKMQYKCFYCPFRASSVENIKKHQNNSHVGQEENIFYYYYYQGDVPDEADGTSRWLKQRQMAGITDIGMTTSTMMTKSTPVTITNTIPNPVNASHSVDLNVVKMEVGGDMNSEFECNLEKLCKRFGKFIAPYGLYYFCPLCKVVAKDTIETMRRHLYAELNYKKWGCRLCFYKTCDMKDFRSHMFSAHRTHTTQLPQDPVILPTDIDLENWVRALLDHQTAIIKGIKDNTEQKQTTVTNNTKSSDTVVPTSESISDEKCSEENVACTVGPSGQINNSEPLKFLRST